MIQKKHFNGITLMELLVSLNIICLAIFVMAATMCMLLRSSQKNVDDSAAYIAADSVMKEFIAKNRYNIPERNNFQGSVKYGQKRFNYSLTSKNMGDRLFYIYVEVFEVGESDDDSTGVSKTFVKISTLQRELPGGTTGGEE